MCDRSIVPWHCEVAVCSNGGEGASSWISRCRWRVLDSQPSEEDQEGGGGGQGVSPQAAAARDAAGRQPLPGDDVAGLPVALPAGRRRRCRGRRDGAQAVAD
uniref:Uncharacterized protein n=1 Tax=Oryza brachyantha TaxID=4533 RepID=J3M3Q7_ORYBR